MENQHVDPTNVIEWRTEISNRQLETEKIVNGLAISVSRMEQAIADLATSVRGMGKKDFPFATVISFASLLLVLAGGYATLMMIPLRDQQSTNTASISSLQTSDLVTAKWQGRYEGLWEQREKRFDSLSDQVQQTHVIVERASVGSAYSFGRQEAFDARLDKLSELVAKLCQHSEQ